MATRVRDWAAYDFYELLGVEAGASGDDIARAFRAAAKRSHPDATDDPVAAEQFKDLAAAYTVLSDRRSRRDYDRVRAAAAVPHVAASAPAPAVATARRTYWTRSRAWLALVGGVLVTVLGVAAAAGTWYLRDRDATQRARFEGVTAARLANGEIAFDTPGGRHVVVAEPQLHGDPSKRGPTVDVRYDPADPTHVVLDASTVGRDVTLAIVALKFLIGGAVFVVIGGRALRRTRPTAAR